MAVAFSHEAEAAKEISKLADILMLILLFFKGCADHGPFRP
jgi:hypothetical protein